MQHSVIRSVWGCTRLGMLRRGSMASTSEYSTAHLFRPGPSKLATNNKNKTQLSNEEHLQAFKEILNREFAKSKNETTKTKTKKPFLSSALGKTTTNNTTGEAPAVKLGRPRRDEEITSRWITFVDNEGQVHQRQRLDSVLQDFDRSVYFLVEVDPVSRPPVCRLFEKKQLFEKQKASKKKKTTGPDQVTKEIVFGWNVSPHDMGHKLDKAMQFLEKGNKVKVDIVFKKGQNRVDKETQQQVIGQVKMQLNEYKLVKAPTMSGSNCSMMFEQKK
ncbi:translation initiation factor IF-3, C-terminal domain-containing protein [Chlamydoabsidia padenii]|nr:translation initiation factor IF-3, C-terminal domain-containing protein [Chlamydoabsidia padenii]